MIFISYLIFSLNYLGTTLLAESLLSFLCKSGKRLTADIFKILGFVDHAPSDLDETDTFRQFHLDFKAKDKPVFPVHARILEFC